MKTPKSRRSLILPKRAITVLRAHRKRQAPERLTAGKDWQDKKLVFCRPDGQPYTRDALKWRFATMTRRAGLGHWHTCTRVGTRRVDHEPQRRLDPLVALRVQDVHICACLAAARENLSCTF